MPLLANITWMILIRLTLKHKAAYKNWIDIVVCST